MRRPASNGGHNSRRSDGRMLGHFVRQFARELAGFLLGHKIHFNWHLVQDVHRFGVGGNYVKLAKKRLGAAGFRTVRCEHVG